MADLAPLTTPCEAPRHELVWSAVELAFVCRNCGRSSQEIVEELARQPPDGSYHQIVD